MPRFFLAPIGGQTGLTSVSLGLVRTLQHLGHRPSFFKPVAHLVLHPEDVDSSTHFAKHIFHLNAPKPIPLPRVKHLMSENRTDDLLEEIVANFSKINQNEHDVMIIEGLVPDAERSFLMGLNIQVARSLNAEIILVLNAQTGHAKTIAEQLDLALSEYSSTSIKTAGYILNKFPAQQDLEHFVQTIERKVRGNNGSGKPAYLGAIPFAPHLSARRMLDIAHYLDATILYEANLKGSRVQEIVVAGRAATHMLDRFKPGALIIAPGDREDVMMATALMIMKGIPLSGIVFTCDSAPSAELQSLITPALQKGIPALLTQYDTFQTANLLANQSSHVPNDDIERMEGMIDFIAEHLKIEALESKIGAPIKARLSPPAFRHRLMEQARLANKRIVLPEGDEPRTIKAATICHEKGIARCVLLGNPAQIHEVAHLQGITLATEIEIIDPETIWANYIEPMVALRKDRGMDVTLAKSQLEDRVILGTMMLALNEVDGLVSGAVHSTASTIRPALQLIKTAPNASLVSSVFFMLMPDQVLVYGDCAVNPDPTPEELADIAISSADSATAFGIEARVAMISYSTGQSGTGSEVEKVIQATKIAQQKRPDLMIDGPLQYDAASVLSVGQQKAPNSQVAGRATVFIFPDLNTGNTTYKAVQRSADVVSVGPMLQGLRKPVNDLSRGALVDDIVFTIALTAIQAVQMQNEAN